MLKGTYWIMKENESNEKVLQSDPDFKDRIKDVDLVSIPVKDNNLSNDPNQQPDVLNTLRDKLEFKGNIRMSSSGKSWNLFRDELEQDDLSVMPV